MTIEKTGRKHFRRTYKEEHYSLIQEPGSTYIGHTCPFSSSATDIAKSITPYLSENGFSLDKWEVVGGCDGTVTNTGFRNGVIRQIDIHVGRPLRWSICLLYYNELPFRHLFQHLDGNTTDPIGYSGPIGKALLDCERPPVVDFNPIDCEFPKVEKRIVDLLCLLEISEVTLTNEEIKQYMSNDFKPVMSIDVFPCHTQAVERCVKLVTEASSKVCGHSSRDGYIRTTLLSRSAMPTFSHKSEFRCL